MSLQLIYEKMMGDQQPQNRQVKINLFEKKFEKIETDFKIKHVHIYIKSGNDQPRHVYGGPVINYQERGDITLIDAKSQDKKMVIKIDKNDAVDVTIIDQHDNIEDEFNVNGMQFTDFDDPTKLSIIKVEEV